MEHWTLLIDIVYRYIANSLKLALTQNTHTNTQIFVCTRKPAHAQVQQKKLTFPNFPSLLSPPPSAPPPYRLSESVQIKNVATCLKRKRFPNPHLPALQAVPSGRRNHAVHLPLKLHFQLFRKMKFKTPVQKPFSDRLFCDEGKKAKRRESMS